LRAHGAKADGGAAARCNHDHKGYGAWQWQQRQREQRLGRFDTSNVPGEVRCAWPGSSIVARFRGTGISAEVQDFGKNYFQVVVDGKELQPLRADREGMNSYVLASGLAQGEHDLVLFKRTDADLGEFALKRLIPEGSPAEMLAPPPPPPPPAASKRIAFLGDSITAGSGATGHGPACPLKADVQNHYVSYAAVTARMLGVEHQGLAWGGKTIAEVASMFDRTLPSRADSHWDFSKEPVDVVVINLGTNDFALLDPGPKHFVTDYVALVEKVRRAHPNALVVCLLGPMLSDVYPPERHSLSQARIYIKSSIAKLESKGDKHIVFFEVKTQKPSDGYGCAFHPSVKTHEVVAEQLSKFLKEKMGW
jgi:lysophospholipase L1-like esterase